MLNLVVTKIATMLPDTLVNDVMTTTVITVTPNDIMSKVEALFKKHGFHHLPVVNQDGILVGIISQVECYKLQNSLTILRQERHQAYNDRLLQSLIAEDVMQKDLVKIAPGDTLEKAANLFRKNAFHALPVVDTSNKLLGMLTTYDLIEHAYRPATV